MTKLKREERKKIEAGVARGLRKRVNNSVVKETYVVALAKVLAPWLYENGLATFKNGRLSLVPAKKLLKDLARDIRWMQDAERHHGQQATEIARKTLRSIAQGKLTPTVILTKTGAFRQSRTQGIQRNVAQRPFAEPLQIEIGDAGMIARRLTCAADVSRVGQAMGNCLANRETARHYIHCAREGGIGFLVLYEHGTPVVLVSFDEENSVCEVKGHHNGRPWQFRKQIIELFDSADLSCSGSVDARELAISDNLVQAMAGGNCHTVEDDDVLCEVGSQFMAITRADVTVLFEETLAAPHIRMTASSDDLFPMIMDLRSWLRGACEASPRLLKACRDAFSGVDVRRKEFWRSDEE